MPATKRERTAVPGVYLLKRKHGDSFVARWREVDPVTDKPRVRCRTFDTYEDAVEFHKSLTATRRMLRRFDEVDVVEAASAYARNHPDELDPSDVLWSDQQTAEYLGLSKVTVRRMRKDGDLPWKMIRNNARIPRSAVLRYANPAV